MAKLIVPTHAVRDPNNKRAKWHLRDAVHRSQTVCKRLIWDSMLTRPIPEIVAGDLCLHCLGAMRAEDELEAQP